MNAVIKLALDPRPKKAFNQIEHLIKNNHYFIQDDGFTKQTTRE